MSEKFPPIKPKEFIKVLQKLGFDIRRQTGSHVILRNKKTGATAVVPMHVKELKKGLVFAVLKQIKIDKRELLKYL